ncbi:MAG: GntR family transcriptional regulator [Candidatus Hydrogenedentes bacterium]|nr:GntR family transcriptional regulator [Candidatus Hydrogenedentota bacterium]
MQDSLQFSVNLDSPIAVYVQIENQVMFAIASGRLSAGDRVPSAREMSTMIGVNTNTVIKAYRDLELMGIVQTRRGIGVTVTDRAFKIATGKSMQMVQAHLREAVGECIAVGLKPTDIRSAVSAAVDSGIPPYASN